MKLSEIVELSRSQFGIGDVSLLVVRREGEEAKEELRDRADGYRHGSFSG